MQVITIFNEKGGVGKTTLTGIIGAGLAMKGYRVLLVDACGQGDLTANMGIPKQAGFFKFVKWGEATNPDYVTIETIIKRLTLKHRTFDRNVYVGIVPGNNDTWGIPGSMTLTGIVRSIAGRLRQLWRFDYVLFDTQPSATTLHDAIGLVTDWVICPTDCEPLAAYGGLVATTRHIADIRAQSLDRGRDKARLMGIVPNKFRVRTSLHKHVLMTLREGIREPNGNLLLDHDGEPVYPGYGDAVWPPLPLRTTIPEMQLLQTTMMQEAPELTTNKYLWALIDRVETISQEQPHGEKVQEN